MEKRKILTSYYKLVSAAIYLALIGVVVYGAHNHVYDGFGKAAPWVVGFIFFAMACLRVYGFVVSYKAERSVKAFESTKQHNIDDLDFTK